MKKKKNKNLQIQFKSEFLNDLYSSIQRRRKAMNHSGNLILEYGETDQSEWLIVVFEFSDWPTTEVLVRDDRKSFLKVISNYSSHRGKVVIRIEGLKLIKEATEIVETFEEFCETAFQLRDGNLDSKIIRELEDKWKKLGLRIVR